MTQDAMDRRIAADIVIAALKSNNSSETALYTSDKTLSDKQAANIAAAYETILKTVIKRETSK